MKRIIRKLDCYLFFVLARRMMEAFIEKNGGKMTLYTLRTKLNNERTRFANQVKKRKLQMNILNEVQQLYLANFSSS